MSNHDINLIEKQTAYACVEPMNAVPPSTTRDLFTTHTGEALITLGKIFTSVPPFNDHIDRNTGQLLISIGKKLKRK
jgi:hypothetical protein